jgi:V-type H+-transporting ATPase subunit d
MIDNLVLLITGTLHKRKLTELLKRCHPLGWFEGMPALGVPTNAEELYHTVLVETPLGTCTYSDVRFPGSSVVKNGQRNISETA